MHSEKFEIATHIPKRLSHRKPNLENLEGLYISFCKLCGCRSEMIPHYALNREMSGYCLG